MGKLVCKIEDDHLIVDDGCELYLNKSPMIPNESEIQQDICQEHSFELRRVSEKRGHLFYMNTCVVDIMIMNGPLVLKCPECGETYKIGFGEYVNIQR